ncbi:MAG: nucleoside-diphosphate kinase [Peptostreptococcaceae bacterium]|nr:nucleoside-diphosphate kinase [Peptostreptococcaceae bacterium]
MMEKTLVVIKPDAFSKGNIGNIISIYESGGLLIEKAIVLVPSEEILRRHYKAHSERPFFDSLIAFMSSGKVMALVITGESAVARVRGINGATDPANAEKGTIRNLYGSDVEANAVHGSEDVNAAKEEIGIWFE